MAARRRNRNRQRSTSAGPPATGGDRADPSLDNETRSALALFNARLQAQADQERHERRIARAVRRKDDAAARVRALEADPSSRVEDRAEAAQEYREALEEIDRLQHGGGDSDEPAGHEPLGDDTADDTPSSTTDDTPSSTTDDTPSSTTDDTAEYSDDTGG